MARRAGLWIDHDEAVIVFVSDRGEETRLVTHESPAGRNGDDEPTVTSSRRRGRFYDEVAASLADARTVLIFGLDEATRELEARLDRQECGGRIIGVGTAERMTAPEIASEVRQRFGV